MANDITDPRDPDYCETCGGECVADCPRIYCDECGARLRTENDQGNVSALHNESCSLHPASEVRARADAAAYGDSNEKRYLHVIGILTAALDDASSVVDAGEDEEYAYQAELELGRATLSRATHDGKYGGTVVNATKQIDGARVFVVALGRAVQVTAIATSIDAANRHCATHAASSVIAQIGDEVCLLADHEDRGKKVTL